MEPDDQFDPDSVRSRFVAAIAAASAPSGAETLSCEFEKLYELCGIQARELAELRRQLTAARASAASISVGASGDATSTGIISTLRARLIEAQDDLLAGRDAERASSAERVRLAESNMRLTDDNMRLRAAAQRNESERARLVSSAALDKAAAAAASGECALLRVELQKARSDRDALAAARDELATTLGSFASERVSASGTMQAELNAATEMMSRNARAREAIEARLRDETARADAAVSRAEGLARDMELARAEARVAAHAATQALAAARSDAQLAARARSLAESDAAAAPAAAGTAQVHAPAVASAAPAASSAPAPLRALSEARSGILNAFSFVSSAVRSAATSAAAGSGISGSGGSGSSTGAAAATGLSITTASLATFGAAADFAALSHSDLPVPSRARGSVSCCSDSSIVALSFLDSSGARVVAAAGARLLVLDTSPGGDARAPLAALVAPALDSELTSVAPARAALYAGLSDRSIAGWDVGALTCTRMIAHAHAGAVAALAWSPGGSGAASGDGGGCGVLLSGGAADTTAKLWDLRDRGSRPVMTFAARSHVNAVAFAADGSVLIGTQDGFVRAFDSRAAGSAAAKSETAAWPAKVARGSGSPPVTGIALGADGLVLASTRDAGGTSALWLFSSDVFNGGLRGGEDGARVLRAPGFELPSRFSRGLIVGRHVVAGSACGAVHAWSLAGEYECAVGAGRGPGGGGSRNLGRTARARRAASAAANRDPLMGGAFAELDEDEDAAGEQGPQARRATAAIHSVALSSDGSTMATGSADGVVAIWEVDSGSAFAGGRAREGSEQIAGDDGLSG
jgi:WD40 repeat protein